MSLEINGRCEFCLEKRKYTSANTIVGFYCIDCLRNARKELLFSIKTIQEARAKTSRRRSNKRGSK